MISELESFGKMKRKQLDKNLDRIANDPELAKAEILKLKKALDHESETKEYWHNRFNKSVQDRKVLEQKNKSLIKENKFLKGEAELKDEYIKDLEDTVERLKKEVNLQKGDIKDLYQRISFQKSAYEQKIQLLKQRFKDALKEQKEVLQKLRSELNNKNTELEDLFNRNQRMIRLLNADSTNSGWTTATDDRNPKQGKHAGVNKQNSRTKTGNKQGGQPGHQGHRRKHLTPTEVLSLPVPQEVLDHPDLYEEVGVKSRNRSDIEVAVSTLCLESVVYRNIKTGKTVYTPFPADMPNEQNYGANIKAMAFILTNICNVSVNKARSFIDTLTQHKITLSTGTISKLTKDFAKLTQKEQRQIYKSLISGHYMNHDLTRIKVNGETKYAGIAVNPDSVHLDFLQDKTKDSIKKGPIKDFSGIGIVDHDPSYQTLFREIQECLVHVNRYLKDSMEYEPEYTWNKKMYAFLQELVKKDRENLSEADIQQEEEEFKKIVNLGAEEYEKNPPAAWYPKGRNLINRMMKKPEDYLRFLRDKKIPWHNNDALYREIFYADKTRNPLCFKRVPLHLSA